MLNIAPRHEDLRGSGGNLHPFLIPEVSGQIQAPSPLPPIKEPPYTHRIRSRVGRRAGLDAVARKINPSPCRELNPGRPAQFNIFVQGK